MSASAKPSTLAASGRYTIFFAGHEVGEERWSVQPVAGGQGLVARGDQLLEHPHPIPSKLEWRAELSPMGRVTGLEVHWLVGERSVRAEHSADGDLWRARLQYGGHTREQEGDYPSFCEVMFGTHLFYTFAFQHYVLEPGAEHIFPALVIGPPWLAVEPGRQRIVCTAVEERDTPAGPVRARRIEIHDALGDAPAFALWLDDHDVVIESFEGTDPSSPWMRLVEYQR